MESMGATQRPGRFEKSYDILRRPQEWPPQETEKRAGFPRIRLAFMLRNRL